MTSEKDSCCMEILIRRQLVLVHMFIAGMNYKISPYLSVYYLTGFIKRQGKEGPIFY